MHILVTRPQPWADRTAHRLSDRGHRAIVAPLLTIVPTNEPMPRGEWDAIVLTSASALVAFAEPPTLVPVLAVGDRTAEAAEEAGFTKVRSASGDIDALALLAREALPPEQRLLIVAGRDRKEGLEDVLREAGHDPKVWLAYTAEAAERLPQAVCEAAAAKEIDCVLHYSPRSAAICLTLMREEALDQMFSTFRHVCISEDAAEPIRACGATRVSVASRPEEAAMFDLL